MIYLAITVLRDNAANRLNRLAAGLLFFAGLGPLFISMGDPMIAGSTAPDALRASAAFKVFHLWELFFPILLIFSWAYPVDRMPTLKKHWIRYLLFAPFVLHILLSLFYSDILSGLGRMESATSKESVIGLLLTPISYLLSLVILFVEYLRSYDQILFGILNLIYVGVAIYFFESGRLFVTNPRLQTQTSTTLWGLRLGLGIYGLALFLDMVSSSGAYDAIVTAGYITAPLAGAGFIAYALIRYRLFDVRMVFRQSLVYTFASAALVGLYILIVFQAETFLTPMFGEQAELVSYLFIVLLLLLFQPISNALDNLIRSMFMHTRADYRNIVERFSRQIISMFDLGKLKNTIEETFKTSLLVERVYFVLYNDKLKEYAFTESSDYEKTEVVDREDLMLRGINLLDSPTSYASLARYAKGSELAEELNSLQVKLILPMKDADHLLGFIGLTDKIAGYRYTAEDMNLLGVLSNQMVSALTNARLYVESLERIRLQEEVNMARTIQLNLLPGCPPVLEQFKICAGSTPSRTVGGDFYDFIEIDGGKRIGMVIADASGKGVPAALMIAQIQAIIRSEINNGNRIATMMQNTNAQIAMSSSPETYVTLFYAELDVTTGELHYANAGHNWPIVVRTDGSHELLEVGGPIIGAFPAMEYSSSSVKLNPGDLVFLFTDGLSEAMDADENEYGEDRIRQFITELREHEPDHIMNSILADVYDFSPVSPPADDTTVVAIKMMFNGDHDRG